MRMERFSVRWILLLLCGLPHLRAAGSWKLASDAVPVNRDLKTDSLTCAGTTVLGCGPPLDALDLGPDGNYYYFQGAYVFSVAAGGKDKDRVTPQTAPQLVGKVFATVEYPVKAVFSNMKHLAEMFIIDSAKENNVKVFKFKSGDALPHQPVTSQRFDSTFENSELLPNPLTAVVASREAARIVFYGGPTGDELVTYRYSARQKREVSSGPVPEMDISYYFEVEPGIKRAESKGPFADITSATAYEETGSTVARYFVFSPTSVAEINFQKAVLNGPSTLVACPDWLPRILTPYCIHCGEKIPPTAETTTASPITCPATQACACPTPAPTPAPCPATPAPTPCPPPNCPTAEPCPTAAPCPATPAPPVCPKPTPCICPDCTTLKPTTTTSTTTTTTTARPGVLPGPIPASMARCRDHIRKMGSYGMARPLLNVRWQTVCLGNDKSPSPKENFLVFTRYANFSLEFEGTQVGNGQFYNYKPFVSWWHLPTQLYKTNELTRYKGACKDLPEAFRGSLSGTNAKCSKANPNGEVYLVNFAGYGFTGRYPLANAMVDDKGAITVLDNMNQFLVGPADARPPPQANQDWSRVDYRELWDEIDSYGYSE